MYKTYYHSEKTNTHTQMHREHGRIQKWKGMRPSPKMDRFYDVANGICAKAPDLYLPALLLGGFLYVSLAILLNMFFTIPATFFNVSLAIIIFFLPTILLAIANISSSVALDKISESKSKSESNQKESPFFVFPVSGKAEDREEAIIVEENEYCPKFPIPSHLAVELHDSLADVETAKKNARKFENISNGLTEDDPLYSLALARAEDMKETLELATETLSGTFSKINKWQEEERDKNLLNILTSS